ncbi:MAG: AbrB/MazE/SpoVT family DNA-binding domain-containing protein [Bryobacteraceae bacterium]
MPDNQTIGRTSHRETSKVGKRGAIVVPARFRRKFGIEEGSLVITEEREDGILIRPAVALPVEIYTPERKAEFILSTAIDEEDYQTACETVRRMGLDPDRVKHARPAQG